MAEFRLVFPNELEEWHNYDLTMIPREDRSTLEVAVDLLGEKYYGNPWYIHIDDAEYVLGIEDICHVWKEIPQLLQQIVDRDADVVRFSFLAQGVDTVLCVETTTTEEIVVSVLTRENSPEYFNFKSNQPLKEALRLLPRVSVSQKIFVDEWESFVRRLIDVLINKQFIEANDPTIEEYLSRMP